MRIADALGNRPDVNVAVRYVAGGVSFILDEALFVSYFIPFAFGVLHIPMTRILIPIET